MRVIGDLVNILSAEMEGRQQRQDRRKAESQSQQYPEHERCRTKTTFNAAFFSDGTTSTVRGPRGHP